MTEPRDSLHYTHLAKAARRIASEHEDAVVRRKLRETAVEYDRKARELARGEDQATRKRRGWRDWLGRKA